MKEKNIKKLDDWYASIGSPKLISLNEAKSIYQKMVQSDSKEEQKELFDRLLLGTIRLVYTNIRNSFLPYVAYQELDIEDLLYAGIDVWMEALKNGTLLKLSYYANFFTAIFFIKLKAHFIPKSFGMEAIFHMSEKKITKLFLNYLKNRSQVLPALPFSIAVLFSKIYSILDEEIQLFDQEKTFSERHIEIIFPYLIQKVLYHTYNEKPNFLRNLKARDSILEIENKVVLSEFRSYLASFKIKKSYEEILYKRLDDMTLAEIAEEYHCSEENISRKYRSVQKAIQTRNLKKLKNFYRDIDQVVDDFSF